jgi:hypothetical protein
VQLIAQLTQQVEPVHPRQFHVCNQCIRLEGREFGQRVFGVAYAKNFISPALQQLLVALARIVFVFDNQYPVFSFVGFYRAYSSNLFRHAARLIRTNTTVHRLGLGTTTLTRRYRDAKQAISSAGVLLEFYSRFYGFS